MAVRRMRLTVAALGVVLFVLGSVTVLVAVSLGETHVRVHARHEKTLDCGSIWSPNDDVPGQLGRLVLHDPCPSALRRRRDRVYTGLGGGGTATVLGVIGVSLWRVEDRRRSRRLE